MFTLRELTTRFSALIIIFSLTFSAFQSVPVSAQGGDGVERLVNAESGRVSFIGPESGRVLSAARALETAIRPQDPAIALAKRFGPEFGLKNPANELSEIKTSRPEDGRVTVHYQQNYQGIPVMGGELIVNTNQNGDLYSMNGEVSPDLALQTQPTIDPAQARDSALQAVAKWYLKSPADFIVSEPELWIFDESLLQPSTRPVELVWRMEVTSTDSSMPVRELVLVNAQKGGISLHFNQVDTEWAPAKVEPIRRNQNIIATETRTSTDTPVPTESPTFLGALSSESYLNALAVTFYVKASDDSSCLGTDSRGVVRPVGGRCDIGAYESSVLFVLSPYVNTYTASDTSSLPGSFLCNQSQPNCTNGSNPQADAAHKYAIGTYNLYGTQFNRDSIDNNGMVITSTVDYCDPSECPYDNAFWSGSQMVYGEGYSLADDIVGHELTHGVTQYESSLFYYYQSGAINESLSDVFGEYYDQTNGLGNDTAGVKWLHGEDLPGGAYRNMSNPPAFNDPDKMTSANYYLTTGDSGGVHTNSGVNNKATFLMVDGGTFNGKTVTALGWVKTAAIYYEAQSNLLSSGADYSDLYYALQQACTNLIGQKGITSGDCLEVKDAVDAVEMNLQPIANFNTDAPMCNIGVTPNTIFHDDLESGPSNWTFANGGDVHWQYDSPYGTYAHSGTHFLYADDYPAIITDATARLTAVVIPADGYLTFHHAYDFEKSSEDSNYYDGGVLEYSVNGGSNWADAGPLIDYNGYIGVINSNYGNPLANRNAFAGVSHGYINTRLNLASLAGKSVIFRWRMGLDEGSSRWGWWLDDVQVYACAKVKPYVLSSVPANANPTKAANVNFTVTFSDPVTGVNTSAPFSDLNLTTTGITGASVTAVTGTGATRTVSVNTGTGSGTIRLDIVDDDTIRDALTNPLGGTGLGNGNFTSGESYTIDKTMPTVSSITRVGGNPAASASVSFTVTFSEPVSSVDIADFTLISTEVVGASISSVSGSGTTRVVQVKTGIGDGTIRLNLVDDNTIIDSVSNPLGGAGAGNGNFSGETYTIDKPDLRAPILRSPRSKVLLKNNLPSFWWTSVQGAQSYEIQFAEDNLFTVNVVSQIVGGSSYSVIIPLSDGTYYWRVRAYNVSDQPGTWSSYRILTIDTTAPPTPVLSSPASNFSTWRIPIFRWQLVNTAVAYQFQYDNSSGFTSPNYSVITRGNFRRPPVMKVGTYYWRVRAKDAAGNWSAWSAPFTINITEP